MSLLYVARNLQLAFCRGFMELTRVVFLAPARFIAPAAWESQKVYGQNMRTEIFAISRLFFSATQYKRAALVKSAALLRVISQC
jgi:hypothetical protein